MTEAIRSESKRCAGMRKDGTPCTARVMGDKGDYCFAHDPQRAVARDAARRKGGANSATNARVEKLLPSHMRPVLGAVLAAIRDVRAGTITPAQGSAIASLAGAAVKVYQVGLLEERIADLEALQEGSTTA